jgi:hypothetical protein
MASYVFYPGDGVQTDFAVPFPYLSKSHVKVYAAGVAKTYVWVNPALIRVSPAIASGINILMQRETQKTPMTQFANTNNLTAENLTLAETQALYIAEEASDRANQSIVADEASGQFDFALRRAINVDDPIDPQDAATKHWAETAMSSQLASAITAASTAVTNAGTTTTDRATVAADKATVAADKSTVSGWKDTISAWKDTIQGWYNSVNTWQAQVATNLTAAVTARTAAEGARDTALTHRTAAATSATNAFTSESNAAGSATAAASSATAAALSAASVDGPNILVKDQNLAGLTDAAVARTNLGLGDVAVKTVASVAEIRTGNTSKVPTVADAWSAGAFVTGGNTGSGSLVVDCNNGSRFHFLQTGNVALSFANPKNGQVMDIVFQQDATGGRTVSFAGNILFPDGIVPPQITAPSNYSFVFSAVFNGSYWLATGWKVA